MPSIDTNPDMAHRTGGASIDRASALALQTLTWLLAEPGRTNRFVSATGLYPDDIRERCDDPAMLSAVIGFVEAYEPDLVICAEALGCAPRALVQARITLETL